MSVASPGLVIAGMAYPGLRFACPGLLSLAPLGRASPMPHSGELPHASRYAGGTWLPAPLAPLDNGYFFLTSSSALESPCSSTQEPTSLSLVSLSVVLILIA